MYTSRKMKFSIKDLVTFTEDRPISNTNTFYVAFINEQIQLYNKYFQYPVKFVYDRICR